MGEIGRFVDRHGDAAETGEGLLFEPHPDGLHAAEPQPAVAQAPIVGKPFDTETAKRAARRRHELAQRPNFVRQELEFIPCDQFKQFDSGRRDLLDRRIVEVVSATGAASAGVCTTLRGYAWMIAFAEFWAVQAATTGSGKDADRAARFFKTASLELAKAWELARVEQKTRGEDEGADLRRRQADFQRQLAQRQALPPPPPKET